MKLVTLLNESPLLKTRIKKVAGQIKKDKKNINRLAEQYNRKYGNEIREGTRRKQLLLSEGIAAGLSEMEAEKQAVSRAGFIPTVQTPILNWLYFFMNEHRFEGKETKRQLLNEKIGHMTHKDIKVMENTPELFEYLYGDVTLSQFNKLKKLKAMSESDNENEAFIAYRQCKKLCETFGVDFDRIPV